MKYIPIVPTANFIVSQAKPILPQFSAFLIQLVLAAMINLPNCMRW